ncbi:hypothetical protein [Campylobacter corcagiensis]|uniref:Uncharacterized protein n=1 Tax=Campylobacter corcagiensis TaxID=1448857 RepID=A0A7M1LJ10_9BACT|nr:hypothetical protein [Campylobacter corcagiensis]QKF65504.1 hypothetical protein CCORG_1676 [Campylobacter corcagiensis]QOQ87924.1 hypothetical protein IMC76_03750 [Campylobacter corcagiensis]
MIYLVLEDDLLLEYLKFKYNKKHNKYILLKILKFYKDGIVLTKNQIELIRKEISEFDLKDEHISSFVRQGYAIDSTIEDLAKQTRLKVILSKDKNDFPYININGDKIENNFTATFKAEENRNKAKDHLNALLKNANEIMFYDKYINDNFDKFKEFINENIEKTRKKLYCYKLEQKNISIIKGLCKDWTIKSDDPRFEGYRHDRYIIVDGSIEIILTSGLCYLYDIDKDFTYIIRDLKKDQ